MSQRRSPNVSDFATRQVVSIGPDVALEHAAELMKANGFRHLPVMLEGKPVGVITWSDIHVLEAFLAVDPESMPVGEVMTKQVATAEADMPLTEAAKLMTEREIGSLIVMNGKSVAGLFTATDAVRALSQLELQWPE